MASKKFYQFTEEQKFDLIDLWGAEEIVYDCSHPDYFNNTKRTPALKRIANELTEKMISDAEIQLRVCVCVCVCQWRSCRGAMGGIAHPNET